MAPADYDYASRVEVPWSYGRGKKKGERDWLIRVSTAVNDVDDVRKVQVYLYAAIVRGIEMTRIDDLLDYRKLGQSFPAIVGGFGEVEEGVGCCSFVIETPLWR